MKSWSTKLITALGMAFYLFHPAFASAVSRGMTWEKYSKFHIQKGYVAVGCDASEPYFAGAKKCDPHRGDTPCTATLPILCIRKDPSIFSPDEDGDITRPFPIWVAAEVKLAPAIAGTKLTSSNRADLLCQKSFGASWKIAEFNDGRRSGGFIAKGEISGDSRFWVRIKGRHANCWNRLP